MTMLTFDPFFIFLRKAFTSETKHDPRHILNFRKVFYLRLDCKAGREAAAADFLCLFRNYGKS